MNKVTTALLLLLSISFTAQAKITATSSSAKNCANGLIIKYLKSKGVEIKYFSLKAGTFMDDAHLYRGLINNESREYDQDFVMSVKGTIEDAKGRAHLKAKFGTIFHPNFTNDSLGRKSKIESKYSCELDLSYGNDSFVQTTTDEGEIRNFYGRPGIWD